jgi:PncC family amidohydrolase
MSGISLTRAKSGYQNRTGKIMPLRTARLINRIFITRGITLSVAESCTGGLIGHYLTALPGASRFFEACIVAYSATAKKRLLGVPGPVISRHGMVSEETAWQMAKRVRVLTKTDAALSTTGNLGPDVLEGKPKGLVYVAVSTKKETVVRKLLLKGARGQIKEKAALSALTFLAEVIARD